MALESSGGTCVYSFVGVCVGVREKQAILAWHLSAAEFVPAIQSLVIIFLWHSMEGEKNVVTACR